MTAGSERNLPVSLAWLLTQPQKSSEAQVHDERPHLRHGGVAALDVDLRTGFDQRLHVFRVSANRRYEERRRLVLRGTHDSVI